MRFGLIVSVIVAAVALAGAEGAPAAPAGGALDLCPVVKHCGTLSVGDQGSGNGSGIVTSDPAGIDCRVTLGATNGTCSHLFTWPSDQQSFAVHTIFVPAQGSVVRSEGGVLNPPGASVSLTTSFFSNGENLELHDYYFVLSPQPQTVSVTTSGNGTGKVTSSPAGIDCSGTCSGLFPNGSTVTLKATPASGSAFKRWSGACDGQGATCTLKITQSTSASALFEAVAPTPSPPPPSPPPPAAPAPVAPAPPPATPAQVDKALEAELVGVKTGKSALGRRLVRVEISADEKISVALALTRNRRGIVGKRVGTFAVGLRVVTLVVPDGVRAGWTRLVVTLADTAGNKRTLIRRVKVGATAHAKERKR